MGVYRRKDSPFFWLRLERPGAPPIREPTKIPVEAYSAEIRKQQKQAAQDVYAVRMSQLARGDHDLPTNAPTIGFDAYARWFDKHHIARRRGADRDRYALKPLRAFFGSDDLATIDRPRVQEYITHRLKTVTPRTVTESTVNREVDLLKGMLREAVPKYLKTSPLAGMKKLRAVGPPGRIVEPEEEARLLAAFRRPADRVFYLVAVDTLIRLSNVINLRWSEVKGGYLALDDSKTGAYRVPLSDRAAKALHSLPRVSVYVFPHRRGAKTARDNRGTLRRLLQRACKRANIPYGRGIGVTFHTATRATGATRMLRAGKDPRTVQAVGNWKDFRSMQRYLHPDTQHMREAVNAIAPPADTPATRRRKKRGITPSKLRKRA